MLTENNIDEGRVNVISFYILDFSSYRSKDCNSFDGAQTHTLLIFRSVREGGNIGL